MARFITIGNISVNLDLVTTITFQPKGCTVDEETGECSPALMIRQIGDWERLRLTGREAEQLWQHVATVSDPPFSYLDRRAFDDLIRHAEVAGMFGGVNGPLPTDH
jgi:hypothetical protein